MSNEINRSFRQGAEQFRSLPGSRLSVKDGHLVTERTTVVQKQDHGLSDVSKFAVVTNPTVETHDIQTVVINGIKIEVATPRPHQVTVVASLSELPAGEYKVLGLMSEGKPMHRNSLADVFGGFFGIKVMDNNREALSRGGVTK